MSISIKPYFSRDVLAQNVSKKTYIFIKKRMLKRT